MFELIFLKILLQISLFLLQTVPKCYINIQYTVKNLVKMIFKPPSPKKLLFLIRPNPKKFQICNGDIYEIWLTLLCETLTYFNFRAVQKAVVHGSRHSCDGSRFPPIFVRLYDFDVLSWVYEVAFPGKSLAATKPEPERPIARPPPRPQRPPPQPQGPSIDPFGTTDTLQGGKY